LDFDLAGVRQRHEVGEDPGDGSHHGGVASTASFQDFLELEKLKVQLDMVGTAAGIVDSRAMAAKGSPAPGGSPTAAPADRSSQLAQRQGANCGVFPDLEATHVEIEGE
jgi:hypothetical protein